MTTKSYSARLGAIIALDVKYDAKRLGVDGDTLPQPVLLECAADFADYCLYLGEAIERIREQFQALGDFYPVLIAEEMAEKLSKWTEGSPLPRPQVWATFIATKHLLNAEGVFIQ